MTDKIETLLGHHHVDEFLSVPGAKVVVDHWDDPCRIEEMLATVGRIAATQPKCKVRYQLRIE